MCYEIQVLHNILPKLNLIHVSNNEHIQLVGKTFLQSLERFFLSWTENSLHYSLDQSFFPRASLETSNETRLYLLKLDHSNFTDLLYQYFASSKYRLLKISQLLATDF